MKKILYVILSVFLMPDAFSQYFNSTQFSMLIGNRPIRQQYYYNDYKWGLVGIDESGLKNFGFTLLAGEYPNENWDTGDIVISEEKAKEQSENLNQTLEREIMFLAVHATLHLLGYDHELSAEDELVMINKQKEIIKNL